MRSAFENGLKVLHQVKKIIPHHFPNLKWNLFRGMPVGFSQNGRESNSFNSKYFENEFFVTYFFLPIGSIKTYFCSSTPLFGVAKQFSNGGLDSYEHRTIFKFNPKFPKIGVDVAWISPYGGKI